MEKDRTLVFVVIVLLVVNLAATMYVAVRPPQTAVYTGFAQVLGQVEAENMILRAQLQQAQQRMATPVPASPTPAPTGGKK
jgi:uncharacterized membrane protein